MESASINVVEASVADVERLLQAGPKYAANAVVSVQTPTIDVDELTAPEDRVQSKPLCYLVDKLTGRMRERLLEAMHSDKAGVVVERCDPHRSLLVFNRSYGHSVQLKTKESESDQALYLMSALQRGPSDKDEWEERFPLNQLIYMPAYGGVQCTPAGEREGDEDTYAPKPAVVDKKTRSILTAGGQNVGWRSLIYEPEDDDAEFPPGIVAFEAWVFRYQPVTEQSADAVQPAVQPTMECVDETDDATIAACFQQIIDHAGDLATAS